jgi:hypothetical protein
VVIVRADADAAGAGHAFDPELEWFHLAILPDPPAATNRPHKGPGSAVSELPAPFRPFRAVIGGWGHGVGGKTPTMVPADCLGER